MDRRWGLSHDHATSADGLAAPARLALVQRVLRTDEPLRSAFDRVTTVVVAALVTPVSLLSLVDADEQHFRSCIGLPARFASGTPLTHSLCQHVVERDAPLVLEDARRSDLTATSPAIADLGVIAYAGVPIRVEGVTLGSLCAIETSPRPWSDRDLLVLSRLAELVSHLIAQRLGTHDAR